MANPFEGMDDDEKEYQKVVGENVNKRMEKAMGEIKVRDRHWRDSHIYCAHHNTPSIGPPCQWDRPS